MNSGVSDAELLASTELDVTHIIDTGGTDLDMKTYMRLYTIYWAIIGENVQRQGLYAWLEAYLQSVLQSMQMEMSFVSEKDVAELYATKWSRYCDAAVFLERFFARMERFEYGILCYDLRQGRLVYSMKALFFERWKECILETADGLLLKKLRQFIETEGSAAQTDASSIEIVRESFIFLEIQPPTLRRQISSSSIGQASTISLGQISIASFKDVKVMSINPARARLLESGSKTVGVDSSLRLS